MIRVRVSATWLPLHSIIFCHIHSFNHPPSLDFLNIFQRSIHPPIYLTTLLQFSTKLLLSFPFLPCKFKMSSVLFQPSFHNTDRGQPTSVPFANYSEGTVNSQNKRFIEIAFKCCPAPFLFFTKDIWGNSFLGLEVPPLLPYFLPGPRCRGLLLVHTKPKLMYYF